MPRTLHRLGVAALFAASVAFAQSTTTSGSAPTGSTAAAQPDQTAKVTASVSKAYSEIDRAKGVLSSSSTTRTHTAIAHLGKAEHALDAAKSALPAGGQPPATRLIAVAKEKVASARALIHSGHLKEADQMLGEIPPRASVEQSLRGMSATGVGGAGAAGTPPSGTPPSR